MSYTYTVFLNNMEIHRFNLPVPLNDDQLCEFDFKIEMSPSYDPEHPTGEYPPGHPNDITSRTNCTKPPPNTDLRELYK
jgi:hypothetical protein